MPPFPIAPAAFSGEPRRAPADAAFAWLGHGWAVFAASPGLWLAMTVLLMMVAIGVSIVPLVGPLAANLLTPMLSAGMLAATARLGEDGRFELGDLFAGFRHNSGGLATIGMLYMAGWLAIALFSMLVIGGSLGAGLFLGAAGRIGAGVGAGLGGLFAAALLTLLLGTPLLMAVWFAPALVYFHAMAPVAAMKASFAACLRNWLPYTVFSLIGLVLCFFAALPLGLGFLVLIPVLNGALYASYKDIFLG